MNKISIPSLEALLSGFWLSDLSNFASYVYHNMENVNWAGFYLTDGKELKLGPFMGKPACLMIPYDKGVCGKAFSLAKPIMVDDVHSFEGHISCDPDSRSELVVPFYIDDKLVGVFDLDSPSISRFTEADKIIIGSAVKILSQKISDYPGLKYGSISL
jgi:GAF domain-containing protein